jgi:hypothetical protein
MMHLRECREFAEQCRMMAKSARDKLQRAQFLRLAAQWDAIARTSRKFLKLKRKVKDSLKD